MPNAPDDRRARRAGTPASVAAFADAPEAVVELPAGGWRRIWRQVARDRVAVAAAFVLALLVLAALLAPWLAPYDPAKPLGVVSMKTLPPSGSHWFGTDAASRDVFSRMLDGARVSMSVAALSVLLAASIGTAVGSLAGYAGGAVEAVTMRAVDALLSIPRVLLLLAVLSLWGALSIRALILLIGVTGWFAVARLVRAEVLAVREREFVTAARGMGAGHGRILVRHVLPQVLSPVFVAATLGVGQVIVLEAGLSFLGFGVQPPRASWGSIIRDGREVILSAWWITVFPGLALVLTVLAVNVLADRLRTAMSPRQLPGS